MLKAYAHGLWTVQVCDATGDATKTKADYIKINQNKREEKFSK
jgi:hypothetical protein